MYKVIKAFTDLQDDGFVYLSGEEYPRKGANPSKERIDELSGDKNRLGYPLIALVKGKEPDGELIEEVPEEKPKRRTAKK